MSDAPKPGSPEDIIEQGVSMIARGIFRLCEAGDYGTAENHLSAVVSHFSVDKLQLNRKISGMKK